MCVHCTLVITQVGGLRRWMHLVCNEGEGPCWTGGWGGPGKGEAPAVPVMDPGDRTLESAQMSSTLSHGDAEWKARNAWALHQDTMIPAVSALELKDMYFISRVQRKCGYLPWARKAWNRKWRWRRGLRGMQTTQSSTPGVRRKTREGGEGLLNK